MSCWSIEQLVDIAAGAGFPDPALAAAIAMAESGGQRGCPPSTADDQAVGDTGPNVLGPSKGLWQIDVYFHPDLDRGGDLFDPYYNAQAAYQVWLNAPHGGKNFSPWSTFNSGAYKAYYAPELNANANPSTGGSEGGGFPWNYVAIAGIILGAAWIGSIYLTHGADPFRRLLPRRSSS